MEINREEIKDKIINKVSEYFENEKKTFFCHSCAHKNVCKKIEESDSQCSDFSDATTYQRYSSIYHFFQPIFDWIKFHYPAGEIKFIVDHNSAKMMIEHGPGVFSKELQVNTSFLTKKQDDKNKEG